MPVLLGGVFKLTGNRSPTESLAGIRNKPEYERFEMEGFICREPAIASSARSITPRPRLAKKGSEVAIVAAARIALRETEGGQPTSRRSRECHTPIHRM